MRRPRPTRKESSSSPICRATAGITSPRRRSPGRCWSPGRSASTCTPRNECRFFSTTPTPPCPSTSRTNRGRILFAAAGRPLAVVEVPSKDPSMVVRCAEPYNAGPPLETLRMSLLTPVQLFFVRNHGTVPVVDTAAYRLTVTGLVNRDLRLSLPALQQKFAPSTVAATLQCAGNRRRELNAVRSIEGEIPWDAEAVGTATWTGVPLGAVLRAAGVRARGRYVHLLGLDSVATDTQGFGGSIPLEKTMRPEGPLAYEMNGSPLLPVHGFPLRVVVPGYIGARSVKWLRSISVAAEPSHNYFQSHAYKLFPSHDSAQTVD